MSWFFDTIFPLFSNGDEEKAEAEKKKKKRPVSEDDDGDADGASPATPPLRVTRHRLCHQICIERFCAANNDAGGERRCDSHHVGGCSCCNRTTLPARGRENEPRPTCV